MPKILFSITCFAAVDAAFVAAVPSGEVFDDVRTTAICVIGAIIGAFLTVAVFPPTNDTDTNTIRRLALKFGSSMLSGIAFTPGLMQYIGLEKTTDLLMATAAIISVFAVTILHLLAPRVESIVRWMEEKNVKQ